MIDEAYTMRCDRCHRYLDNEWGVVAEYGDRSLIIAEAQKQGWRVTGDLCYCPHCRETPDARG